MRVLAILGLVPALAFATPTSVQWQGRFVDTTGTPTEGSHAITVSLYDPTDQVLWRRQYPAQTLHGGYLSLELSGSGSVGGTLDTSHFTGSVFVGVQIDTGPELSPRQALTSVPRAAVAQAISGALPALGTTSTCDATSVGTLRYDSNRLEICSGGGWKLIVDTHPTDKHIIVDGSGVHTWSDGTAAQSCEQYRNPSTGFAYSGATGNGVYTISPPGFTGTNVECDMDFQGHGWTLVGRGIGGAALTWNVASGNLNTGEATNGVLTFKFSDALINAIPKAMYRFVGFGEVHQDWYWNGSCVYGQLTTSDGICNQAYHTAALASGPAQNPGNPHSSHRALGDWTDGTQDHLHTSHVGGHWYIKDTQDNTGGSYCNGNEMGCDVLLYVR